MTDPQKKLDEALSKLSYSEQEEVMRKVLDPSWDEIDKFSRQLIEAEKLVDEWMTRNGYK